MGPAHRDRLVDARRLVTQAMRLSPPEPSFLDMRNAILLADEAAGGTRRDAIWTVFARRGMGYYASTTGSDDTSPVEDFSTPPAPASRAARSRPRDGRVHRRCRWRPPRCARLADGGGGRRRALHADRRAGARLRELRAHRARLRPPAHRASASSANATTTLDAALRRNWAARRRRDGRRQRRVRSRPRAAARSRRSTSTRDRVVDRSASGGKAMVVTLPAAVDVDHFEIDPAEGCGDDLGPPRRQNVRIETSTTTTGQRPVDAGGDADVRLRGPPPHERRRAGAGRSDGSAPGSGDDPDQPGRRRGTWT